MLEETATLKFVVTLTPRNKLGLMLAPSMVNNSTKPFLTFHERITDKNLNKYNKLLDEHQLKIVKCIEEYNDHQIFSRFTNQKISLKEFMSGLTKEFIQKFIRPFVDKKMDECIRLVRESNNPLYYLGKGKNIYTSEQISIHLQEAETLFHFIRDEEGIKYFQTIRHNNTDINLCGKNGLIITNQPCWILLGQNLYYFPKTVDGKKMQPFLDKEYVRIPGNMERKYLEGFVLKVARDQDVHFQGIGYNELHENPVVELSIETDYTGLPSLTLVFIYGKHRIFPGNKRKRFLNVLENNNAYEIECYTRQEEFENHILNNLQSRGLKMYGEGYFKPFSDTSTDREILLRQAISWVNEHSLWLKEESVILKQQITEINYFTEQIQLSFSYTKERDWFDIYAIVHFGKDISVPFIQLKKNILNGIREYELPNGEIAILPESWFSKYKDLLLFGKKQQDVIRVNKHHFPVLSTKHLGIKRKHIEELYRLAEQDKLPACTLPSELMAYLRTYQVDGFNWLKLLGEYHFGACLADDMGLGKTLQALAVLLHYKKSNPRQALTDKPCQLSLFDQGNGQKPPEHDTKRHTSLIVMPASLIHNWINEILKFTPDLTFCSYTGSNREKMNNSLCDFDLVLTTYGIVRNDIGLLQEYLFNYIILDESQVIKNPKSKTYQSIIRLNSIYRIVLTGTPIENSLMDLWSQMNFLNRGLLGNMNFFKDHFMTPIEKQDNEKQKNKLQHMIRPFILRRTKNQVAKELPPLTQEFYYCDMTEEQKEIYDKEKSKIRNLILEDIEQQGVEKSAFAVLQALTKLRQLANHPSLISEDYKYTSGKFEEVCRSIEILINENHKVLVFSSFVKHLKLFAQYFKNRDWGFSMLTGATVNREKAIQQFTKEEKNPLFLISLKAGGVGLNLTEADYVFLLDPWWNPAAENQAINRAHRIRQDKSVFVYRFITINSIEEKIIQLQQKKSELANTFISSNNPLKSLNRETIEAFFE